MKNILKLLKTKDYFFMAFSLLFIVTQVWLDLKMPDYMNIITTELQQGGNVNVILRNGGMMLLCSLGSLALSIFAGFFAAKIASGLGLRLREKLYDKVHSFSKTEISRFSTSSLITRTTNDTTQVQMLIAMGLQIMIKAPVLAIWAIIKILGKNWQWSLVTGVVLAVLLIVIITLVLICLPKFKIVQKQTDDLNRVTRENLTGIRIVHAFNAEKYQQQKFEEVNSALTKTQLFTSKTLSFLSPMMSFLIGGLTLAIYWVGAYLINNANLGERIGLFSDMVVFSTYAMQVISAFIMMVMIFMQLPRTIVSIKRINEVLNTHPSITDGKGVETKIEGCIEFKNVNFKYPDGQENILSDISLKINKGETVAFIGSTGSGKSTLINLIPRFYDVSSGEILIDGENVKDYKLEDLHNKIGYVSQKAILLSGTVYENITMGHDIEPEDILKAIEQSQSKEFVDKMEEKGDVTIYQGGKNISGGQKQRLSIARALVKKPEFIIFDDSFSALDYKTDKKLRDTLNAELEDTTCLIVAQRIGTIRNADKIVVLDKGNIVGMGTHDQLLKTCKVYKEIALSQLSKEEL